MTPLNKVAFDKACKAFYAIQEDGYTNAKIAAAIQAYLDAVAPVVEKALTEIFGEGKP
jgi:hypothetical protein